MERKSSSKSPVTEEVMEMIQDLCDLAGYGIHSGINIGMKGEAAAGVTVMLDQLLWQVRLQV